MVKWSGVECGGVVVVVVVIPVVVVWCSVV